MQKFYLTPLPTIVIIISLLVVSLALFIYYMYNKTILSIYRFKTSINIEDLIELLKNYNSYQNWWIKFKKLYIYKVSVEEFYDSNLNQAKIILYIHTNLAKETWHIFLETHNKKETFVTVSQETNILSKFKRITHSSIFYKKDLINFKKDLKKRFV